jgi:hypothetical protein
MCDVLIMENILSMLLQVKEKACRSHFCTENSKWKPRTHCCTENSITGNISEEVTLLPYKTLVTK